MLAILTFTLTYIGIVKSIFPLKTILSQYQHSMEITSPVEHLSCCQKPWLHVEDLHQLKPSVEKEKQHP